LRIYLADDHNLVAQGLSSLIKRIEAVDELTVFNNGKLLFDACARSQPDVVFLDIEMPVWDGLKTLIEIKRAFPSIRCIMLSMFNEKEIIEDCIENGAMGYLNKNCSFDELKEALSADSEVYFSKSVLKSLSGYAASSETSSWKLSEPLTEREKEILTYLCEGLNPKEIGEKIHLSHRTVETHKMTIMQKFSVSSVAKLISKALKNKLV
jgi:DNA-binding NarL/FixJ family response regulator